MRYFILAILAIPTILLFVGIAVWTVSGWSTGIPPYLGAAWLLSFVVSIALIFVFPNAKEWRIAAGINSIPFVLLLLLGIFFWVAGIDS